MKEYRIVFKKSVLKDIRKIPQSMLRQIQKVIDVLRTDPIPQGVEKIRGYEKIYRVRVGRYRLVYEVGKEVRIITIIRIAHRKDVYKKM